VYGTVAYTSAISAGTAFLLRRTLPTWPKAIGAMVGTVGCQIATVSLDHRNQLPLKALALTGFGAGIGATYMGLSLMFPAQAVMSAALGTMGVSLGAMGVAAVIKDMQQLPYTGALAGAGMAVSLCGLGSMIYPNAFMFNVWLLGGLGVYSIMMMYASHTSMRHALENPYTADYINDGTRIYVYMAQVFSRLLMMQGQRNKH
jgi:hypothetical protein